jgi:hypothetical protein
LSVKASSYSLNRNRSLLPVLVPLRTLTITGSAEHQVWYRNLIHVFSTRASFYVFVLEKKCLSQCPGQINIPPDR